MELADVLDSKSSPGDRVRVRPPPPAPWKKRLLSADKRRFLEWCLPCRQMMCASYMMLPAAMMRACGTWLANIASWIAQRSASFRSVSKETSLAAEDSGIIEFRTLFEFRSVVMKENKLAKWSMNFSVQIVNLVKPWKQSTKPWSQTSMELLL